MKTSFNNPEEGANELILNSLDPSVVLEKIVIDFDVMKDTRLHMDESEFIRLHE